jgi:PKD repeat protein
VDCGGASCSACAPNTPPLPQIVVTPGVGSHDGTPPTVFQGDATGTSDLEDAPNALTYSWDWENDGVIDATGLTSTHSYGVAGTFEVQLSVQDTSGLSANRTFFVIVSSESNVLQVTTAADESDGGATPASPGGTGFSLREAMIFANGSAGKQSIRVPAGFVIALGSTLPTLTDASGVDLIGDGAVLDGSLAGFSSDCLQVDTSQTRVFGFEIRNCTESPLRVRFVTGIHISRLFIHDNAQQVFMDGAGGNVFGPDNEVSRSASHGMTVLRETTIERNEFHDNAIRGLDMTGSADGCLVLGNVITGSDPGIFLGSGSNDHVIVHNTLHANSTNGIRMNAGVSGNVLQNNIFSNNANFGVDASDARFSLNDHNDYFANTLGTCSACSLGTGSLTSDPEYVNALANDFRLQSFSPAVNAGIDTGRDVNGGAPGNGLFNGANPDLGARETP